MNEQKWAAVLALGGFVIMAFGLGMDTTVEHRYGERTMNLYLMQRQNITVLFGGFLLIVGVILFVAAKLRRPTRHEVHDDIAPALKHAADEVERQKRQAAMAHLSEESQKRARSMLQRIRSWFLSGPEPLGGRLLTAWFVGLCMAFLVGAFFGTGFAFISFVLIFAYAFRSGLGTTVQFHLHCLNFVAWACLALMSIAIRQIDLGPRVGDIGLYLSWVMPIIFGATALISLVVMLRLRLQARRQARPSGQ